MQNQAANSRYSSNAKFSRSWIGHPPNLSGPPTARGKLLREFASAFGHWLGKGLCRQSGTVGQDVRTRSGGTPGTD